MRTARAGDRGHPTRLGELMPVATRDDVGLGEEMRRVNIADSRLWAYRAGDCRAAGRPPPRRPRPGDRRSPAPRGAGWARTSWVLADCSEFLPDEVALIMNCSRAEATRLAEAALILLPRLLDTWAALADGELNWPRARAIAAEIARHGPELDPQVRATVEAVVPPQAAELPVAGLRALVRAELLKRDPDGGRAPPPAGRGRRRRVAAPLGATRAWPRWSPCVPQPVAAAIVRHRRRPRPAGEGRRGQPRARCDPGGGDGALILRPGADGRPPVTAELHVRAPLAALLPDPATRPRR